MTNYHSLILEESTCGDLSWLTYSEMTQETQENHNLFSITNNRDTNQGTLLNLPINLQIPVTIPEDSTRVTTQEDSIPTRSTNNDPPTLSSSAPSENVGTPSLEAPTLSSSVPNENVGTPSLEEVNGNKESINQNF